MAWAAHVMVNESPVFKLNDVFDVTNDPLKTHETVPAALAVIMRGEKI